MSGMQKEDEADALAQSALLPETSTSRLALLQAGCVMNPATTCFLGRYSEKKSASDMSFYRLATKQVKSISRNTQGSAGLKNT